MKTIRVRMLEDTRPEEIEAVTAAINLLMYVDYAILAEDEPDTSQTFEPSIVEPMIDDILRREAGYVNDPDDAGGATNRGITQETLGRWRELIGYDGSPRRATPEEVKTVTKEEAFAIYKDWYYTKPKVFMLPLEVQPIIFDGAVLFGPGRSVKMLQQVVGAHEDGLIGDNTARECREYIAEFGAKQTVNDVVNIRISHHNFVANKKPSQEKFLKGWINRANEFRPAIVVVA